MKPMATKVKTKEQRMANRLIVVITLMSIFAEPFVNLLLR